MTLAEQVLAVLQRTGPLDDDQLGAELGVSRQSVRAVAKRLSDQGVVTRQQPDGGKWRTSLGRRAASPGRPPARPPEAAPERPLASEEVANAIRLLYAFTGGYPPKRRLVGLETRVQRRNRTEATRLLGEEKIDDDLLTAALVIKQLAGEINVVIHAVGMLLAIPLLIDQPSEQVIATSLGAGAGTRPFDLETTHRVAEFKFTHWRGNDALRQRELFADFVNLAESGDRRLRQLFVTGIERPKRFLFHSKRSLESVCRRRPEILEKIEAGHGGRFQTVSEYAKAVGNRVQLIDLEEVLPTFITRQIADAEQRSDELNTGEAG